MAGANCRICLEEGPDLGDGTRCECEHDDLSYEPPSRGTRFLHARQITEDRQPETCVATKVTRDRVYFRNSTGFLSWVAADRFCETVREILPTRDPEPKEN
jgi:hypothetical protein